MKMTFKIKERMGFYFKWHSRSIKSIFTLTVQWCQAQKNVFKIPLQGKTETKAIFRRSISKLYMHLEITFKKRLKKN